MTTPITVFSTLLGICLLARGNVAGNWQMVGGSIVCFVVAIIAMLVGAVQ